MDTNTFLSRIAKRQCKRQMSGVGIKITQWAKSRACYQWPQATILFLIVFLCVWLTAAVAAAPPRKKNKPNERHGRDMQVIDGTWQTLLAPTASAPPTGWEREPPKDAKDIAVPSLQGPNATNGVNTATWYWRRFDIPADWRGQTIRVRLEAVAESAQVWLNGRELGTHQGGGVPFEFNATAPAHTGGGNVLAVRVVGGRWGSGIWQGVLLLAHDEAYLNGCFPQTDALGHVNAALDLLNTSQTEGDAILEARIVSAKEPDRAVQKTHQNLHLTPGRNSTTLLMTVGNKQRVMWSPDTPALYRLQLIFRQEKDVLDTDTTTFGFREWGYREGAITLNNAPVTLKSLTFPTTRPTVIASVDDEGRLRAALHRLKENGVTLLYVNAPPPVLLRLADEEGLLIMEGSRTGQNNDASLEELRGLVKRDRAHPSVLGWNLGNLDTEAANAIRTLDATRFLLVGTGTAAKLWPPNQNAPAVEALPINLLPALAQ